MAFLPGRRVRQIGDNTGPFWIILWVQSPGPPITYTCRKQYWLKPDEDLVELQDFDETQIVAA